MNLLEAQHVTKSFPIEGGLLRHVVGRVQALRDVSVEIREGEVLALVGGSGSGKSTLAKIIVGLLEVDEGALFWEGRPLKGLSPLERAHRIQMVFQDPFASLNPKLSVGTQLHEVVRIAQRPSLTPTLSLEGRGQGRPQGEQRVRDAAELLESVGLSADALRHYPFQFSGGQRQRIAIARALAMSPRLLVADEPLSSLDVTTQAKMLELFRDLKRSYGLTILLITHDLAVAHEFAERVVVLQEGKVVEEGIAPIVLKTPKHPYTKALLEAVPKIPC